MKEKEARGSWDLVLTAHSSLFSIGWKDIWKYRDLLMMFVKRDIVVVYKQTILGPVWFFVQPILTTAVYLVVFGNVAKLSTDGIPKVLFYSAGVVIWNFFSETFNATSKTFVENATLFGKVYFPRLVVPISKVISGLIKFLIQFSFFILILVYYIIDGVAVNPTFEIVYAPLLLLLMASLGLGFGIIFSSLTTKYRDLTFVITFGVQLLMYATPVIYPLSSVPDKYKVYILANPVTSVVEGFRFAFMGSGVWSWAGIGYSAGFAVVVLLAGILIFNKVEETFMDTV